MMHAVLFLPAGGALAKGVSRLFEAGRYGRWSTIPGSRWPSGQEGRRTWRGEGACEGSRFNRRNHKVRLLN